MNGCGRLAAGKRSSSMPVTHNASKLRPCASSWPMTCTRASPDCGWNTVRSASRSEEHTSELQSLMRISYAVFCLKKTKEAYEDKIETRQRHNNTKYITTL